MSKNRKNKTQKKSPTLLKAPRNSFAISPLMKKGGVHQKSKSAERSKIRRETKKQARDWSGWSRLFK